jgi:hypothetical protein
MHKKQACLTLVLSASCVLASAAGPIGPVFPVAGGSSVNEALKVVAQATAAARDSASAASAAAERIAILERTVERLRAEAQAQREQAEQLREQLEQPGATGAWPLALGVATLGLAALSAWLLARLLALRRLQDRAWGVAVSGSRSSGGGGAVGDESGEFPTRPPTSAMAFLHSEFEPSGPGPLVNRPARAGSASASPPAPTLPPVRATPATPALSEPASQRTEVLAHPSAAGDAVHEVSIDELLDLEQQADFFVVLGQDDAAVALLVEHLRHTGGSSPLPYLKLLEIHRRRGERSDYERMRARFNHRFNAHAPEWEADGREADGQGSRLLQDYPGVLKRLQQVWPRPLDAMAELEALMFRRSRGELFDLPAYREVMLLYTLSRDLLDRESAETGHVDLLLPLFQGSPIQQAGVSAAKDAGLDSLQSAFDFEDRPTAPVDLDLSFESEPSPSIFNTLSVQAGPARAR